MMVVEADERQDSDATGREAMTDEVRDLTITLQDVDTAPARARRMIRQAATAADWDVDLNLLELLVDETVANAVALHEGPITVEVFPTDRNVVRVETTDLGFGEPTAPSVPPVDSASGRGLLLIDRLARRWGVRHLVPGKIVWFELERLPVSS